MPYVRDASGGPTNVRVYASVSRTIIQNNEVLETGG